MKSKGLASKPPSTKGSNLPAAPRAMLASDNDGDEGYKIRDDARTLVRAHQIKSDKKRHKKAKAHIAAMAKIMQGAASEQSTNQNGYRGPNTNGDADAAGLGV
jgi:hypothetical protein